METLTREGRESWFPSGVSFSQFNRMFIIFFFYLFFLLFLLRMNMSFLFVPCFDHFQSNSDDGSAILRHQWAWDDGKKLDFLREEEQCTHAGMPLDPI